MANRPYILVYKHPFTNLPFGICAIYFDLKVDGCNVPSKWGMNWAYNPLIPTIDPSTSFPGHPSQARLEGINSLLACLPPFNLAGF